MMSVPAPAPPPHLYLNSPISNGSRKPISPHRPLPHIKDLIAEAESQIDSHATVGKLLERADHASRQSRFLLDLNRLDGAFVEHLIASMIILTTIPRHKDGANLQADRNRLHALYKDIRHRIQQDGPKFEQVRVEIIADNKRYKTVCHSIEVSNTPSGTHGRESGRIETETYSQYDDYRPTSMVASSNLNNRHRKSSSNSTSHRNSLTDPIETPNSSQRTQLPIIHPKPQSLHSFSITSNKQRSSLISETTNGDPLSERFSRLRMNTNPSYSQTLPSEDGPLSFESSGSRPASVICKAPMSKYYRDGFSPSLRTGVAKDLPKPPSPAYSPARTMEIGPALETQPRNRNDRMTSADDASSFSSRSAKTYDHAVESSPHNSDPPRRQDGIKEKSRNSNRGKRNSFNAPHETEISAEQLYDYMKRYNVLLIDVRSREDYDSGHIHTQSGICIEPTALRRNQSAEQLFESLVLSPESEQILFDQRDEFELVVYHDQSSTSIQPPLAHGPRNYALQHLHDTLCDYNQDKVLSFAPLLLIGGIEAWVNLFGVHALKTSHTAEDARAERKSTRPVTRKSLAKDNQLSNMQVQKKGHRDYNPLAPEEERKWRERARSESNVLDAHSQNVYQHDLEPSGDYLDERPAFLKEFEDFERRFPDASTIEHNRLMAAGPPNRRPPPEPVRTIPNYPTPPVPTVPSRPPPALPRPSYSGISEKVQAQPSATARPNQLKLYIPTKLLKRLPRTGLQNFGVTCYMNATIQCLSATIPLTAFFLDRQYLKYVQTENWKGSKGILSDMYNTLLRNLWEAQDVDTIRPTNFRKFCARLNKEWGVDRQQDAKEFLEFLIDCLHEDLNVNWARTILRPLTAKEEAERERTPPFIASKREWDRYTHRDYSRLTDLFAGQHISRLQCAICRQSSTTYEAFYSISVEIPPLSGPINIHHCLRSYCSAETLSGDEVWRCPHCQKEREATKRITITRAPEFLVIHFKRFSASRSERARKVHTAIDFPLKGLDLEPYMLPPPESNPAVADQIKSRYGEQELTEKPASMQSPYKYDAYAVMRHLGATMTSGHYISLVHDRARGVWREFNDDRVTDFRPEELERKNRLQNEAAYIVFYQRIYDS